jgi:hypothetical protein
VTDRDQFDSTRLGLEVAFAIESLWPGKIDVDTNRKLIGNARVIEDLKNGTDPRVIEAEIADTLRAFQDGARKYLLYPE